MSTHGAAFQERIADAITLLAEPVDTLAPARLSASDYITAVHQLERLGRLVDAARVALAGEAEPRTRGAIDTLGALGYASAVDAVATLTSASDREAKGRIRIGEALNTGVSFTGAETGSAHESIAHSVRAGNLSVEVAGILIDALHRLRGHVDDAVVTQAERGLVELAAGTSVRPPLRADLVRGQAQLYVEALDPDGARPREELAHRKRYLTIGRETRDGLIPLHGLLTLEIGASLKRLIDAHVRRAVTFTDPFASANAAADTHLDDRLPGQKRHDTLADIISAASRVEDAPELAGAAPAITVTVTQTALDSGRGVGAIDGIDTPLSVQAIEKIMDSRGMQQVTMSRQGRVLSLGSTQRCFTPSQRRAITARDGGCVIPGCTAPAGWCEVHHVIPWRDGGETHTENGVLLCWGHHRNIDTGPWELSMPDGIPHVRGPGHWRWTHTTKSRTRTPD